MSDVCLSVAYIGPKSRTERYRKTKIGAEVRDSDTIFKVKRSKVNLHGAGHIVVASSLACYKTSLRRTTVSTVNKLLHNSARGVQNRRMRRQIFDAVKFEIRI